MTEFSTAHEELSVAEKNLLVVQEECIAKKEAIISEMKKHELFIDVSAAAATSKASMMEVMDKIKADVKSQLMVLLTNC